MQISEVNKKLQILHDCILIGISDNLESKITKLVFITEKIDKKITIILKSVLNSRCEDWKFGNIVLDASILENKSRYIDILIFVEDLNKLQIEKKQYIDLLKKIEDKQIHIFELNPSYGAYFVCLFKDIEINITDII